MIYDGQPITQEAMNDLANMTNDSLLPLVNAQIATNSWPMHEYDYQYWQYPQVEQPPYEFPPINNAVQPPTNITGTITYEDVQYNDGPNYPAYNISLGLKIWSYKSIDGIKTYSMLSNIGSIVSDNSHNSFTLLWSWTPPATGADGYIVSRCPADTTFISSSIVSGSLALDSATKNEPFDYTDVGSSTTFEDDGFPILYPVHNPFSWGSTLNRIKADFFTLTHNKGLGVDDLYYSKDALVSGPHICGISDHDTYNMDYVVWTGSYWFDKFQSQQGELYGTTPMLGTTIAQNPNYTCLKNVQYTYALNDSLDGLTVGAGRRIDIGHVGTTTNTTMSYSGSIGGEWKAKMFWTFQWPGSPTVPPDISNFTITTNPSSGINWSTVNTLDPTYYALVGDIDWNFATAPSASIAINVSGFAYGYIVNGPFLTSKIIYDTTSDFELIEAIHPTSDCMISEPLSMPDGDSNFMIMWDNNGTWYSSVVFWYVSDSTVKGIWSANSLPIGGNNCFIDQDLPNYVGQVRSDIFGNNTIAVSPNIVNDVWGIAPYTATVAEATFVYPVDNPPTLPADGIPILASSLHQQTLVKSNDIILYYSQSGFVATSSFPDSTPFNWSQFEGQPQWNVVTQAEQSQPAQWPLFKSGSVESMPLRWGQWNNDKQYIQTTPLSLDSGSYYNDGFVLSNYYTKYSLRLRNPSPLNALSYGQARIYDGGELDPSLSMSIYIKLNDFPTTTDYDIKTSYLNEITFPSAEYGGDSFFNAVKNSGGFNCLIQNETSKVINTDVIVTEEHGVVPREQRFNPSTHECFSYAMLDVPPGWTYFYTSATAWPSFFGLMSVPQSGYMIYAVSVHRKPKQDANGIGTTLPESSSIDITFGQYRQDYNGELVFAPFHTDNSFVGAGNGVDNEGAGGAGEPYSITIASGETDTGIVNVAWPVVYGTPLIYSSTDDCVVQCWANWNPKWFNSIFGFVNYYSNMDYNYTTDYNFTDYQFCNEFINFWRTTQANWPNLYGEIAYGSEAGSIWPTLYGEDVYGIDAASTIKFPMSAMVYNDIYNSLNLLT